MAPQPGAMVSRLADGVKRLQVREGQGRSGDASSFVPAENLAALEFVRLRKPTKTRRRMSSKALCSQLNLSVSNGSLSQTSLYMWQHQLSESCKSILLW